MPFTDFLKTTVLLIAGEATALAAVTVAVAAGRQDSALLIFSLVWWVIAAIVGAWIGRRPRPSARITALLAGARTHQTLPEIRPGAVIVNRLWPLGVSAVVAAALSWLYPQLAAVATGYAIMVALAWRKHEAAVTAIEIRDGARFYVVPGSPFGGISLTRTPGYRSAANNGGAT